MALTASPVELPVTNRKLMAWLTPGRCRGVFAVILLVNFAIQWRFLTHDCPIDLSGDEAQYWDWSRHLDLSYYSKGPAIAYIIRASCMIWGDNLVGVRSPAMVLAVGTSICIYWLTRKLFGSDRLALGAFLLAAVVPMYAAGSALMTIDPPFFFFWALTTCFGAKAILDGRKWAWVASGIVVGLGFLTKYAMGMWLPFVILFLAIDRENRRWLKTVWPWVMVFVALLFTTPVVVWNAQHHWASLRHVATQTGTNDTGGWSRGNLLEFIGAQVGIINPMIAALMGGAIVYAMGRWSRSDPQRRQLWYLLCIGLPFLVVCGVDSLRSKVQPNWPAPAYFTLLILTAYFISTRLRDIRSWKPWRGWFWGATVFGVIIQPVVHGSMVMYSVAGWMNRTFPRVHLTPSHFDIVFKLRLIDDPFAKTVGEQLSQLPVGSFVLCEDYQDASQLAFYLKDQPKTYFVGSYWTDPEVRRRRTQFDMWPDRDLDQPGLIGRDVIYIGTMAYAPLRDSFERVTQLPDIIIEREGMKIRSFQMWKCEGFKGISRPDGEGAY